jgi:hypothetical protein
VPLLTSPAGSALLAGAAVLVAAVLLVATVRASGTAHRVLVGLSRLGWCAFVLVVVWLTVSVDLGTAGGVNLVPFETVRLQLAGLEPARAAWNLLGNLALLVPFALLARPAWGWRVAVTTGAGVLLSVVVEVGQLFAGRSADVDDVIVNGLGALLGAWLAAVLARRAVRPRLSAAGRTGSARDARPEARRRGSPRSGSPSASGPPRG